MKKITVLLSDDHTVFREGLRSLLQATDDIDVIGEAENGHRALGETKRLQPDVVLMDIGMPQLNGVEATRLIARQVPSARVLILSTYSDDAHLRQAVEAGAVGYLTKTAASEGLVQAIRDASTGQASFSARTVSRLLKQRKKPAHQSELHAGPALSGRQTEVLRLIAESFSNKRIASLLCLSIKTVEKHRQLIMDKLDIHKVATLTRYAISCGLVGLQPRGPLAGRAHRHPGRHELRQASMLGTSPSPRES
jgi:DNA-binding NarL/FixJ family response regulator